MLKYFENECNTINPLLKSWNYIDVFIMLSVEDTQKRIQELKNEYFVERAGQNDMIIRNNKILIMLNNAKIIENPLLNDYDVYKFEETEEEYEIRFLTMILQRFENAYENYQKFKYILFDNVIE
jgi:hypothetical protein